jgi:hypothetical protein
MSKPVSLAIGAPNKCPLCNHFCDVVNTGFGIFNADCTEYIRVCEECYERERDHEQAVRQAAADASRQATFDYIVRKFGG